MTSAAPSSTPFPTAAAAPFPSQSSSPPVTYNTALPYPTPSLSRLAWLLHPVSLHTFFTEYWERKPLHIARGDAAYYGRLLSRTDVERIIQKNGKDMKYSIDLNLCHVKHGQVLPPPPLTTRTHPRTHNAQPHSCSDASLPCKLLALTLSPTRCATAGL